jgi:hypothetical protein
LLRLFSQKAMQAQAARAFSARRSRLDRIHGRGLGIATGNKSLLVLFFRKEHPSF